MKKELSLFLRASLIAGFLTWLWSQGMELPAVMVVMFSMFTLVERQAEMYYQEFPNKHL